MPTSPQIVSAISWLRAPRPSEIACRNLRPLLAHPCADHVVEGRLRGLRRPGRRPRRVPSGIRPMTCSVEALITSIVPVPDDATQRRRCRACRNSAFGQAILDDLGGCHRSELRVQSGPKVGRLHRTSLRVRRWTPCPCRGRCAARVPGSSPVALPSTTVATPFTSTRATPFASAVRRPRHRADRARSVACSEPIVCRVEHARCRRSCPAARRPRSCRPNSAAGSSVIICTASLERHAACGSRTMSPRKPVGVRRAAHAIEVRAGVRPAEHGPLVAPTPRRRSCPTRVVTVGRDRPQHRLAARRRRRCRSGWRTAPGRARPRRRPPRGPSSALVGFAVGVADGRSWRSRRAA